MSARRPWSSLVVLALVAAALPAAAENPATYAVGRLPVAPGIAIVEFPVAPGFATEVGGIALGSGTYDNGNPLAYLNAWAAHAWLHFDGVPNLRLSAGFQEIFYQEVNPLKLPSSHEERGLLRARVQQPRGAGALYEMLQLDIRSFDDPTGAHHVVFRPRFRVGQGFNLDAVRIHSLVLYQELALRFSTDGYEVRNFEFFRALVGYTWTTRRGTFVTLALIGQIQLNPAATRFDFVWGPALGISHRFRAAPAEAPPPTPDIELD